MIQRRGKGKIALVRILTLLFVLCSIYSGYQVAIARSVVVPVKGADEANSENETVVTNLAKVLSSTRVNEDDIFTILEIVPYRGMGELGYMVGGCEPIDLTKLTTRDYDGYTSFLGEMLLVRDTYVEKETLTKKDQEEYKDWSDVYVAKQEEGNFKSVEPYTGEYTMENRDQYVVDQNKHGYYNTRLNKLVFNKNLYGKIVKDNNVNAWFYPEEEASKYTAFDGTKYTVANAVKNETHTGDYDYNRLKDLFVLNKGKGTYDVQFMPYSYQRNQKVYYMASEYEVVDDCSGEYTGEIIYVNAPDTDRDGRPDGRYNKVKTENYVFVGPGMGSYNFIQEAKLSDTTTQTYLVYKKYFCRKGVEYTNAEWFKRYAMRLDVSEWDDCKIEVITRTPSEVNKDPSLITKADMLFLSPTQQNMAYVGLWEFFGKDKESLGVTEATRYTVSDLANNGLPINLTGMKPGKTLPTFIDNDLNWNVTYQLFKRIGIEQDLPTVLNCVMYENNRTELEHYPNSTSNNCAKLYLMLRQWNPQIFYENFFETNLIKEGTFKGITTGEYTAKVNNARYIWHSQTFLPDLPNGVSNPLDYYTSNGIDNPYMNGNESVVSNIYTFNGDCIVDNNFLVERNYSDKYKWFYDINSFLFEEDNGREGTDEELKKVTLSTADIFYYLLKYKKVNLNKTELVVLDLEPCNDFKLTEADVRNMIKGYTGAVKIVKMTTAEFNGKIEDLNKEYDMIYMGLNTGMFNTNSSGSTVYNDTTLNGKIYLHVGDKMVGGFALMGLVKDYNEYRFSGNDITAIKEKELVEYISAGYPIVMANDLYTLNTSKIDAYSNIHHFVKVNKAGNKNILNLESFSSMQSKAKAGSQLIKYLSIEKPKLDFTIMPAMYDDKLSNTLSTERKLSYKFSIGDLKAGENDKITYTVKLYIDGNADGRYSTNELQANMSKIKAGEQIELQKTLPSSYVGIVPWKIVVYRTDNPNIRSNQIGYYAVKGNGNEKKMLKILQITSTKYSMYNWTGSTINLQEELKNSNSLFSKYTKDLNDFTLRIETIDVNGFVDKYKGSENGKSNKYIKDNPNSVDRLMGYDMLIFGFGDSYSDISNENGALDNVTAFIDSGKSVLFSHDTTSVDNNPESMDNGQTHTKGVINWGYNINKYFRNSLGMDRYGVTVGNEERTGKDIAYTPTGSNYKAIQGYAYSALIQYGVVPGDRWNSITFPTNQLSPIKGLNVKDSRSKDFPEFNYYATNSVTNVNQGQITEYPYNIPTPSSQDIAKMAVAETHGQYYELDLEDPEIVVWYCLSNSNNDSYDYRYNNLYSSSPNDVRNNYYIYNKGNITYTGAGHRYFGNNEYEVKLFINTMVAAYRATISAPEISVTNGFDNEEGVSFVYVDSDFTENSSVSKEEDMVKISFTVKDDSIVSSTAKIQLLDESGEVNNLIVYDEKKQVVPYNKVNTFFKNTDGDLYEYYILYPRKKLDGKESVNLSITADNSKIKSSKKITLIRRNLFNLN